MVDTLSDRILANDRKQYLQITIASNPLIDDPSVHDVIYRESFDQPCPTITFDLKGSYGWIRRGYHATLNLGYDGLFRRVFTGTVQVNDRPEVGMARISCAGELWKVVRDIEVDERTVSGLTVEAAISALLDDLDIGSYSFESTLDYTLDSDVQLRSATGLAMLTRLTEVDGVRVRELGSGQLIIGRYEGKAAVRAFRKYSTTDTPTMRILDGGLREDPTMFRSQITVLGATLADGTTITATASVFDTTLVQPPLKSGKQIAEKIPIPLIWDITKAAEAAVRIGGERGRIPQAFRMSIPMDPELAIGITLHIDAPEWGITGNWMIWGITHKVTEDITELDMRGGSESGGVVEVNPVAQFTSRAEIEVFGTQPFVLVTLDAGGSHQPDNEDEVLTYAWSVESPNSETATAPDITTLTDAKINFTIDPTGVTGSVFEVKLTVTNEAGRTATATHKIEITGGITTIAPAIYSAMDNRFSGSPDGGQNWNDQSGNASDVRYVAAAPPASLTSGIAVFGRADGKVYRTEDYCATALTEVLQATDGIVDIEWDWRNPNLVWLLTGAMNLYRSHDLGRNWELYWNFRDRLMLPGAIGRHIGLPRGGTVWCYGGTGVVDNGRPLIAFAGGGVVASIYGGELGADLGAGNTNLAIVDAVDAGVGGLLIILENYDATDSGVRPMYIWPTSPRNPMTWKRATGLTAGDLGAGVYVLRGRAAGKFHAAFGDRDVWHSEDGIAWTKTADVMPVDVSPNSAILLADEQHGLNTASVYLIAAEEASTFTRGLYKSHDDIASVGLLRPVSGFPAWPGASKGKWIAVGAPAQSPTGADQLVMIQSLTGSSPNTYKRKTAHLISGVWTLKEDGTSVSQDYVNVLKKLGSNLYRITVLQTNNNLYTRGALGQLQRSEDEGDTWDDVGPAPFESPLTSNQYWGVSDVAISPDGTLWLCAGPTLQGISGILSSSIANPTEITTVSDHGLSTDDVVVISEHTSVTPEIDNHEGSTPDTYTVTVTGARTFTIPVNVTADGGGGGVFLSSWRSRIYKSINDGLTFTEVFVDPVVSYDSQLDLYCGIACHPLNKNIIAVIENSGIGIGGILHTLDGGATDFTFNEPGGLLQSANSGRKIHLFDNGRVMVFVGHISNRAQVTDDYGATAVVDTELHVAFDNGQYLYDFAGTPFGLMFVLGGASTNPQVVRTRDYGETWENIFDGGTDFVASFGTMTALAYDAARDILYIASAATTGSGGARPRIRALDQASLVLAADVGAQTWRNLQLNLDDVFDRGLAHAGVAVR